MRHVRKAMASAVCNASSYEEDLVDVLRGRHDSVKQDVDAVTKRLHESEAACIAAETHLRAVRNAAEALVGYEPDLLKILRSKAEDRERFVEDNAGAWTEAYDALQAILSLEEDTKAVSTDKFPEWPNGILTDHYVLRVKRLLPEGPEFLDIDQIRDQLPNIPGSSSIEDIGDDSELREFFGPCVSRLTRELASKLVGKSVPVLSGQTWWSASPSTRLESLSIMKFHGEASDGDVIVSDGDGYEYGLYEHGENLVSGSGADGVYVFVRE